MGAIPFHVSIHVCPPPPLAMRPIELRGVAINALMPSSVGAATSFAVSFEEVLERLQTLPRMFVEPDGSWVWVSSHKPSQNEPAWQLDGVLYDRAGYVLHMELKGWCPASALDLLLGTLGWPATPVMYQLVQEAIFLDDSEFRRLAYGD